MRLSFVVCDHLVNAEHGKRLAVFGGPSEQINRGTEIEAVVISWEFARLRVRESLSERKIVY